MGATCLGQAARLALLLSSTLNLAFTVIFPQDLVSNALVLDLA